MTIGEGKALLEILNDGSKLDGWPIKCGKKFCIEGTESRDSNFWMWFCLESCKCCWTIRDMLKMDCSRYSSPFLSYDIFSSVRSSEVVPNAR